MKATKKKNENYIHRLKLQNFWQYKTGKRNSHTDKNYTWAASSDLKCLQKEKKYNVDFLRKKKEKNYKKGPS